MTLRVLLVDNDIDFLQTRSDLLKRAGFDVFSASAVAEARQMLDALWVHAAVLDIRLEDDGDPDDISGINLAREEMYQMIPKIIVTGYPSWKHTRAALGSRLDGLSAADEFLAKMEGFDALIVAIHNVINKRLKINWSLDTRWGGHGLSYPSLVGQIDSLLESSQLIERSEELEDLFRMLFGQCTQITIDRILWQRTGHVALVVHSFFEDEPSRPFVVTTGMKSIIARQGSYVNEHNKAGISTGNMNNFAHNSTLHYAANCYEFPGSDLDTIRTLADLYQEDSTRALNEALQTLVQTSLNPWHSKRYIRTDRTLDTMLQERFGLGPTESIAADLAARMESISNHAKAAGLASIERQDGWLRIYQPGGIDFEMTDPVTWLTHGTPSVKKRAIFVGPTLGDIRAETILIDNKGHTWLSDFGDLAEGPIQVDYAALETAIKFDLVRVESLPELLEFEQLLAAPARLDGRIETGPSSVRKAMATIQRLRKHAAAVCSDDVGPYQLALAYHAVRRILAYEIDIKHTRRDVLPAVHAYLSLGVILERLSRLSANDGTNSDQSNTGLDVDEVNRLVTIDGHVAALSPTEYNVVHYLWQHAGQLCSRGNLFQAVYDRDYEQGKAASDDAQLNMLIKRVREKIEPDPGIPRYLITRHREGFVLYPEGQSQPDYTKNM